MKVAVCRNRLRFAKVAHLTFLFQFDGMWRKDEQSICSEEMQSDTFAIDIKEEDPADSLQEHHFSKNTVSRDNVILSSQDNQREAKLEMETGHSFTENIMPNLDVSPKEEDYDIKDETPESLQSNYNNENMTDGNTENKTTQNSAFEDGSSIEDVELEPEVLLNEGEYVPVEYQIKEDTDGSLHEEHISQNMIDSDGAFISSRSDLVTPDVAENSFIDQIKLEPQLLVKEEGCQDPFQAFQELAKVVGIVKQKSFCVICSIEVPKYKMKKHKAEFHRKVNSCDQCDLTFKTAINLKTHRKEIHNRNDHPCQLCDFIGSSDQSLRDHRNFVHLGISFSCQLCDFSTKRKRDLHAHVKQKHEGVEFPCAKCDYVASKSQHLKVHMTSFHDGIRFPCPDCDFVGKYKASLWQHKRRVHEGIQYSCDQCEYKTSTPQNLKEHKQCKHEGITYPCDQCDKTMSSPYTLEKHKANIHEGLKYPCDECQYVGNSLTYLRKHKRNNHGDTHSCFQCQYVTNNPSEMKKHMRKVHEGIRYPCDVCGDEFRDPSSLKQHVESIHKGIRYHCDQCEYAGAANMSLLRRHMKAKHGV